MFTIALEETLLEYPSNNGNALAIIFTGCPHHCIGCHSKNLQLVQTYTESPSELIARIKEKAKRALTTKLVITGGDCLYGNNLEYTREIVNTLGNIFDICIYTGYDIEYVKTLNLKHVKYYKCGTYKKEISRESMKTDTQFILASSNQNFYDAEYNLLSKDGILNF